MPYQPSKRSIRIEQDRVKSADLLKVYGCLLTPKQYAMTAAYCLEGKSFSQIAREHDVSRQAVHEAVRSVQRSLSDYEHKLGLLDSGPNPQQGAPCAASAPITAALQRLENLKGQVTQRGETYSSDWIVQELDDTIRVLEQEASYGKNQTNGASGQHLEPDTETSDPAQNGA